MLFLMFLAAVVPVTADSQADWKIALRQPKGGLKTESSGPVEVTITDAKNAPVADAQAELVLTMVEMDHGETKVPARQLKSGVYEAKPKFMMDGKWNIEVRAKKGSASATMKQQVQVGE